MNDEGGPSYFQGTGSGRQGQDASEHWERGVPAAGAQGGRWALLLALLLALPHLHTSHVNSPCAAPPAPRGFSEMRPTAAFVSSVSCFVNDTSLVGVTV